MNTLSETAKKRIRKIGPNYIRPSEVKYYKQWKQERQSKKQQPISTVFLPEVFRANCPNIGCLSSVDAEDSYKAEIQFRCERCGCSWKMLKKFAICMSNFE